ncbi:hypothetical protein [Streptomyces sp. cg40]
MLTSVMQRTTSVGLGATIGTLLFKERFGAPRIAAAGPHVVGIRSMRDAR